MSQIDWSSTYAAIYRSKKSYLKPVYDFDPIRFDDLLGIETQKELFVNNTKRFLDNKPSNNVLLWGARGCGKSSLIKAALNEFKNDGLRVVEIDRDDFDDFLEISDILRREPYRFIIFCDDLSFDDGERGYRGLKRTLEGSIEAVAKNIKIYATSNKRHLVSEYHSDNSSVSVGKNGEIHYGDTVEEKISLSDRFGLWISFYHGDKNDYLRLVDNHFKEFVGSKEKLYKDALMFAQAKASMSARVAKQFYNSYV